ncbi:NPCBM/NEW2 domain-containing protein [Kineococcus xinjiangensis]|uniref:NPCBM/NEW2 domain-containing protein n=1 Tax=Kineococcus xinjiangensis TaxID=512762 RepID=A0A2S6IVE8_9ACTN|nr:cell wall-binding repeat-containing protein [Kineococcus xinjiangensis]PPK98337.1 NPCBM/NEW2 domain-containing protein [Kineococcus xinjiangensis]
MPAFLHRRPARAGAALALAAAMAVAAVAPAGAVGVPERISGQDRFETAVRIAGQAFPGRAATVYLARADTFPDALAAGALTDGPVLLVPRSGEVPAVVVQAVERLAPTAVVALGSPDAVGDDILKGAAGGRPTRRIGGADRYHTAALLARAAFPGTAPTVYLARGDAFPDALSAGSLIDGPLLLVPSTGEAPEAVRREVQRLAPRRVVALGSQNAVADSVLTSAAVGRTTSRLSGEDRYATSAAIARAAFPHGTPIAYVARADTFPDALAAGSLTNGPVLLVPFDAPVPPATLAAITALGASRVVALGGQNAVTDASLFYAGRAALHETQYLGEEYFGGFSDFWRMRTPLDVDGTTYDQSAQVHWWGAQTVNGFELAGRYASFRTTVGTPGDQPQTGDRVTLDVEVDGRVVDTTVLGVGSHRDVEVDVTGAQRLRLLLRRTPEDPTPPYGGLMTDLGNPRVTTATGVDDASLYTRPTHPQ